MESESRPPRDACAARVRVDPGQNGIWPSGTRNRGQFMRLLLAEPNKNDTIQGPCQIEPRFLAAQGMLNEEGETCEHSSLPSILLVDDQPIGLRALASVFEDQGYEVTLASNGAEAIASIDSHRPDLVLLDVMMPGMDGFQVCRTVRSTPAVSAVPIVLVTAYDDREASLEARRSGANGLVSKPIDRPAHACAGSQRPQTWSRSRVSKWHHVD